MSSEKETLTMQQSISLSVEIPEELHNSVQQYLETHSTWNQDRLFCAAISLFLMQNGVTQRQVSRIYLDSLFGQQRGGSIDTVHSN